MDREKYEEPADHLPLCPICQGELRKEQKTKGGWNCACGEYVPKGCHIPPRLEDPPSCSGQAGTEKDKLPED